FNFTQNPDLGGGVVANGSGIVLDGNTPSVGAYRTIKVGQQGATNWNGDDLRVQAGDAYPGGNAPGGHLYLLGGTPNGSGAAGNVILAHNGTTAMGKVGIGSSTPVATLS